MKKIYSVVAVFATMVIILVSCSEMNDKHDIYLAQGERIYIGKVDSLKIFPGDKRVKVRFWASDPRCNRVGFFWSPFNDSIFVDINKTSSIDSFEVVIGGTTSGKIIDEGSYTLTALTYDSKGHSSVPFEKIINVYGDRYRSSLTNRVMLSKVYVAATGTLLLNFGAQINKADQGIQLRYTDRAGNVKDSLLVNGTITTAPIELLNVDGTKEVSYQTLYLPEPSAMDVFKAKARIISLN